jgi:hypothetical protein
LRAGDLPEPMEVLQKGWLILLTGWRSLP